LTRNYSPDLDARLFRKQSTHPFITPKPQNTMSKPNTNNLFDISGKVIVVSGAMGVLAGSLAHYFAEQGARVVFLDLPRAEDRLKATIEKAREKSPDSIYCCCDVLDRPSLEKTRDIILEKFGRIDVLVNGAGGNMPGAVVQPADSFFNLDFDQWRKVIDLNLGGTLLPILVFAKIFEQQKHGVILNFSSMSAQSALTRVFGYSNSKAAVDNLTKWLAVEFAQKIGPGVRVNAMAPGFFIGEQNRSLLLNPDGTYTPRGESVIRKTPFRRFGTADEIHGTAHFLISDAAQFVTGTIVPIDGGFSAYTGV
jgi:NAD(P)-dependent dehydrogenase (short-subunit alcohol dehydrogenase family)